MGVFDNPDASLVFLVELQPYDPSADAVTSLYVATRSYTTGAADTPANTYYEPLVLSGLSFEQSMYRPGHIGGRSLPGRGKLILVNTGEFDAWLDYQFDGRAVIIKAGEDGAAYSTFTTVFSGVTGIAGFGRNEIILPLVDKRGMLDKLIQPTLYAGTGGNEGGDDLKSKPKPVCLGKCQNITPVPVDYTNRVYQVNNGAIEAIDAVYDNGKLLTLTTDYTVDLPNGRFTLVAAAAGQVTADVRGDKTGAVYVSSAADILERLAVTFGGLADPADLDTASFTALNTATTAVLGFYSGTLARNLLDVMDEIVTSIGGFYGFNRAGLYTVGRFEAPTGSPDLVLDESGVIKRTLVRDNYSQPVWRQRLGYGRAWTVQYPDQLDAAATAAHKSFVGDEFRTAADEDTTVKEDGVGKGGHLNALDLEPLATLLVEKTDAETEVTRLLTLYKTQRQVFHLVAKTQPFAVGVGDEVSLTHSRFGLSAGKDLIIVGFREYAAKGEVELDLWG